MKLLTAFLLATVAVACSGQRIPDEILRLSRQPQLARRDHKLPQLHRLAVDTGSDCKSRSLSCGSCNTVNQCAYVGGSYQFMQSSRCDQATPFCEESTGKCVANLSSYDKCAFPARMDAVQLKYKDFQCYKGEAYEGYYPSPYSCDRYFICDHSSVAYIYNCPSGYIYNHGKAACVPQMATTCTSFHSRCNSQRNSYILHDEDLSLYAYCDLDGYAHVSKCRSSYKIDPRNPEQPCQPYCAAAGRIPNHDDARGYYECYEVLSNSNSSTLSEPLQQWCPRSLVYNHLEQRCVPDV